MRKETKLLLRYMMYSLITLGASSFLGIVVEYIMIIHGIDLSLYIVMGCIIGILICECKILINEYQLSYKKYERELKLYENR